MRFFTSLLLSLVLVLHTGCNINLVIGSAKFKRSETQSIPHQPAAGLRVESANGYITVKQADREDVLINSEIKALTQDRLDQSEVLVERQDNGELVVRAVYPEKRKNGEGCNFEIEIPEATDVALTTSNGRISLTGLVGKAKLNTSNGSVSVTDFQGPTVVKTSNGRISANNVIGDLQLKTSNGSVSVGNANQQASVETSNGSISLSQSANATGPIELSTSNGSVQVDLCSEFSGKLDVKTSNGSIRNSTSANIVNKGKNKLLLDFEGNASESRIKTSNGSVTIRQSS